MTFAEGSRGIAPPVTEYDDGRGGDLDDSALRRYAMARFTAPSPRAKAPIPVRMVVYTMHLNGRLLFDITDPLYKLNDLH
jgi:hypothetical protein